MKGTVGKALVGLLIAILFLFLVEGVVRVHHSFKTENFRWLLYGTRHRRGLARTIHYQGYYKFGPGPYRPEDPTIIINQKGFRGREFDIRKAPHTIRIVTMGGSTSFGYGNDDGHTWPERLEAELNRRFPCGSFEVINAGFPGYTTNHILAAFKAEVLGFSPDILLLYCCLNDVWGIHELKRPQTLATRILTWFTRRSLAILKSREKIRTIKTGNARLPPFVQRASQARNLVDRYEDWGKTQGNLGTIIQLAGETGVTVVLIPELFHLREGTDVPFTQRKDVFGPQYQKMLEVVIRVGNDHAVPVIRFQSYFDELGPKEKKGS